MTLNPGEGVFLRKPTSNAITITFTGKVPEGHLVNPVPHTWSIRSSIVPQAGPVTSYLGYPVGNGDNIVQFYVAPYGSGFYGFYNYNDWIGGEWEGDENGAEPVIKVGEAFWIYNYSSADNWTRDFSIWHSAP